ncbi:hypothetical protein [Methylobacterium oryzihabitans]|uniref:Uncharacterized protein n=1 Tax=Methylobacterium oryzihabitans TaxID=2499852 RepID=A0A437PAK4_9HYPH|nr:hypothetical protein [Methylobacterium oryzihabitans]RVU19138.1 hypothetical protein EOE48_09630 [Methylobacterium oryzihabitans]
MQDPRFRGQDAKEITMAGNDPRPIQGHPHGVPQGRSVETVDQVSSVVILGFAVAGAAVAAALSTILI